MANDAAFWAAAGGTQNVPAIQSAIKTGALIAPKIQGPADQAKIESIIKFREQSQDPVFGATWLYDRGQISTADLNQVKKLQAEKQAALTVKNGGNGMATITNPAAQITGVTAGNTAPKTGDNMEIFGMDISALGLPAGIAAALGIAGTVLGGVRTKWPWQTVEGEGFIAPWSQMEETAGGWVQEGGVQGSGGIPGSAAAAFGGGTVAGAWTNAARNGSTPATAEYIRMVDGKIYCRSLKTGVIKRVPKPRVLHLHSKMNLGTYVRAERMLDRVAGRIAKRTKALKRA